MTLTHFHLDPLSGLFWSMQTGPKRPNKGLTVWISQIVFAHWSIRWLNSHSMPIFILPKVPHCASLDKPVTLPNYMILLCLSPQGEEDSALVAWGEAQSCTSKMPPSPYSLPGAAESATFHSLSPIIIRDYSRITSAAACSQILTWVVGVREMRTIGHGGGGIP